MGGTSSSTAGRRYRRSRRLRHERHGVVAVIGTLLALLVFFALFGIFLTEYVPVWMTDNESYLTAQAAASFAQFKAQIDAQYALGGPATYGTPFTLSSSGVPLIAQPTEGTLVFIPNTCPYGFFSPTNTAPGTPDAAYYGQPRVPTVCVFVNVTESYGPGGAPKYSQAVLSGVLQFSLPNRYYTPEEFYMEDDAVIQSQSLGYQLMAIPPPLNFTVVPGNTSVTDSFVQLYGNASTVVGQGSEDVYSHLRYTSVVTSNGHPLAGVQQPLNFSFTIGTQWPCAWDQYLYKVLTTSGLNQANISYSQNFDGNLTTPIGPTWTGGSCFNSIGLTSILSFQVKGVTYATLYQAGFGVGVGVGGD
jgi:hypothetical protein